MYFSFCICYFINYSFVHSALLRLVDLLLFFFEINHNNSLKNTFMNGLKSVRKLVYEIIKSTPSLGSTDAVREMKKIMKFERV